MLKNIILALSLVLNAAALFVVFNPARAFGPKMSCAQAINERLNKQATLAFSRENGDAFFRVHDYLVASDYWLRNVHLNGGTATFVYVAQIYPNTCGWLMPGIDGSIVRVKTDLSAEPTVTGVH